MLGLDPKGQANLVGLICDDTTYRYTLPAGKSTLILSLSQNVATNRFCFLISGTEGTVQVSAATLEVAPTSAWWQILGVKNNFTANVQNTIEWGWSDVRYLKVELDLKSIGTLSPIGLFGSPSVKDVKVVKAKPATTLPNATPNKTADLEPSKVTEQINVASLASRGRVAYVSSGLERPQSAAIMLDNDLGTAYSFDDQDKNPTFVVEMSETHPICRIATYYEAQSPGAWEVYPLSGLPKDEAPAAPAAPKPTGTAMIRPTGGNLHLTLASLLWGQATPRPLKMPPGFFEQNKPSERISSNSGEPFGAVEFKPQPCRYVLLRWVTDQPNTSPGVKVYQVSIFTDPQDERLDALPVVNFASIGPDLSGAQGLAGGNTPTVPTIPTDPPRLPIPKPPVVSP
ncbi:MAG: hypothetical protein B9S32_09505 [Verrucomicrobia bacterium Tous-C9LFEB]|nr:MAG: hypothetical protein B9S32_09505 [Verrucomicrobia bacterium Tous-C9LFEB]